MQVYSNARSISFSNYRTGFLKRYKYSLHKQTFSCLHLPLGNGELKLLSQKYLLIHGKGWGRSLCLRNEPGQWKAASEQGITGRDFGTEGKGPFLTEWMLLRTSLCNFWRQQTTHFPTLGLSFAHLEMWGWGPGPFWDSLHVGSAYTHFILGSVSGDVGEPAPFRAWRTASGYGFGKGGGMSKTENADSLWPSSVTFRHAA